MIRELANHWPPDYAVAFRFPVREALLAYRTRVRAAALTAFRHDVAVWATIAVASSKKIEPPAVPRILKGGD